MLSSPEFGVQNGYPENQNFTPEVFPVYESERTRNSLERFEEIKKNIYSQFGPAVLATKHHRFRERM